MNIDVEKDLQKIKSHIIDYASLSSILKNNGYYGINDKISKLKQDGLICSLKKGLYLHTSPFNQDLYSKELIANTLLSPSYISFDYALYFYSLIPESVHEVSSATSKRSKEFKNKTGSYTYKQIKKELHPIGLTLKKTKTGNFLIATKEKALCDKVYFAKDIQITSYKTMMEFLIDDLRIDLDELQGCDMDIFTKYQNISKSKKIAILEKVLRKEL